MRLVSCPLLIAAVTGCVQEAATATDPARPAADEGRVVDGTTGWARIATRAGVELLPYVAYRGHAIHQHDLALGPISSVDARAYAAPGTGRAARWPGGHVRIAFHPDFTGPARDTARAAIAELEEVLPVDFHELAPGPHDGPWVEIAWAPVGAEHGALSTAVGMVDPATSHCSPHHGCRTGGGSWIYFPAGQPLGRTAVKHQLLHALGLWHEQSRPDRDSHIAVDTTCIATSLDQFARRAAAFDVGPYDVSSIMHGDSRTDCIASGDDAGTGDAYLGGCRCLPMTQRRDHDDDGRGDRIAAATDLSVEDVNGLWRMYERALGTSAPGDGFGSAVAIGDFDRDGYDDVAIGAPGDDGVARDAGAVYLFKGTSSRLVPWRVLTQLAVPGEDHGIGDGFGAALAAGDVDGDGTDDLVIGVPDEDVDQRRDAGAVHVFRGGRGGLRHRASYAASEVGGEAVSGARFGAALAIGRLTAGDVPELIVGAPGDLTHAGAVYVMHDDPAQVMHVRPTRLVAPMPAEGDAFGAALAVGRIDGGANLDLAIGAPGAAGGGRVLVFGGLTPTALDAPMASFRQVLARPTGAGGDALGSALLIADLGGDAGGEVVAGAPGAHGGSGRVVIWRSSARGELVFAQGISGAGGSAFGSALAASPRIGQGTHHDLVVGAPGRGAGEVAMFRAPAAGLPAAGLAPLATLVADGAMRGDRFGATLALGRLDGTGDGVSLEDPFALRTIDLVVGAPGKRLGGALTVFEGRAAGTLALGRTYTQETAETD